MRSKENKRKTANGFRSCNPYLPSQSEYLITLSKIENLIKLKKLHAVSDEETDALINAALEHIKRSFDKLALCVAKQMQQEQQK